MTTEPFARTLYGQEAAPTETGVAIALGKRRHGRSLFSSFMRALLRR